MKIQEKFPPKKKTLLSIEIFPPKTEKGHANLKKRLESFKAYRPEFISVTYGAGGSTQRNTLELASYIQNDLGVTAMSHLTCVGQSQEQIISHLKELKAKGVDNIMALRGDPPEGEKEFKATPGGLEHGSELIELISQQGGFCIGCAGYPEGHVESESLEKDIEFLELKIKSGASFVVTQFFLDNTFFLKFRDLLRKRRIEVPLIAGILPISNYSQISRFSIMCGCTIPARVMRGLHGKSDEDQEAFGLDHAAGQVDELLREGVDGVHIYALNKKKAVERLAPIVVS